MLQGSIVALVTPFHEDGSVNFEALTDLLEWQIAEGTDGILTLGTTGEYPTMSHEEDASVVARTIEVVNGRVPVIAGSLTSWKAYIMPVIALASYPMAYTTRLAKSSMLDALGQDYIRTARAKGVKKSVIIFKHALRNSLIPVITYAGPQIAYIITGSMVIEHVFTIGGIGSKFVSAIGNRDYTLIMATTIFLAVLMVAATLLCDIIYKLVDPRITFD